MKKVRVASFVSKSKYSTLIQTSDIKKNFFSQSALLGKLLTTGHTLSLNLLFLDVMCTHSTQTVVLKNLSWVIKQYYWCMDNRMWTE